MPVAAPFSLLDRNRSILDNCYFDEDGDVTLEPSNYYLDWAWKNKGLFGDPLDWIVGVPPVHDRHNWYLSEPGKPNLASMTRQTSEPVGIDRPSMSFNQAWAAGPSPPTQLMGDRSGMAPPTIAPSVTLETPATLGLKAGNWWVVAYYKNGKGEVTGISDVEIVTGVVQGGRIKLTLKPHLEEGVAKMGIALGPEELGYAGLRVQREWTMGQIPRTYEITGPWRAVVAPPGNNQTAKGRPKKPKGKRRHHHKRLRKGRYKFSVTDHSHVGESLASEELIFDITEDEPNTALEISLEGQSSDSTGMSLYVEIDDEQFVLAEDDTDFGGVVSEKTQEMEPVIIIDGDEQRIESLGSDASETGGTGTTTQFSTSSRRKGKRRRGKASGGGQSEGVPPTTDSTEDDPTTENTSKKKSKKKLKKKPKPVKDTSGNTAPSGVFELIEKLASQNPLAPGVYLTGYTRTRGEYQTQLSPTASFTLADDGSGVATTTPIATIPQPLNEVFNANFSERNSLGHPVWHTNTPGTGTIAVVDQGKLELDTVGTKASGTPVHRSNVIPIDRNANYDLFAQIQGTLFSAGSFEAVIKQYSDSNGVTDLSSDITLKSIAALGDVYYQKKMGPAGSSWHASATTFRVEHRFVGASRNMRVKVFNWYVRKFEGGARRVEQVGNNWNVNPTNVVPLPSTSVKMISPAPQVLSLPPATGAAIYREAVRFTGTPPSTPDPLPPGWGSWVTAGGHVIGDVNAAAKINGDFGFRMHKTTTAPGIQALYKPYASPLQTSLSFRSLIRIDQVPTFGYAWYTYAVALLSMYSQVITPPSDNSYVFYLGNLFVGSNGILYLVGINPGTGAVASIALPVGVVGGDILDAEIICKNGNSNVGVIEAYIGKNGQPRSLVGSIPNLPWSGFYPRQVVAGPVISQQGALMYRFHFDDIVIADNGGPATLDPTTPELERLPTPDRPQLAGLIRNSENFDAADATYAARKTQAGAGLTMQVQTATPLDAGGYLRVIDPGTSGATQWFATTMTASTTGGYRFKCRVNTLPSAGEVIIGSALNQAGTRFFARVVLSSTGNLYADIYSSAGVLVKRRQIASGITNGQIIIVELVITGAGTSAGSIQAYFHRSTDAVADRRQFMWSELGIDYTSNVAAGFYVGGLAKTNATATYDLAFDSILITEAGELIYEQYDDIGQEIEQTYELLVPGQPSIPGLFLHGGRRAVIPGEIYEASIRVRWAGVLAGSYAEPFWIVAYDTEGNKHSLRCLAEDASTAGITGITGSSNGWVTLTISDIEIPEKCFAIEWESRNMVEGEYVCQSPFFGRPQGLPDPLRAVTYPSTGSIYTMIDSETPRMYHEMAPLNRTWRAVAAIVEDDDNATHTITWASSLTPGGDQEPDPASAVVTDVPQNRYLHNVVNFFSADNRHTSTLRHSSPRLEYDLDVTDTLLTENEQELPGGVVLGGVEEWTALEKVDIIDLETGKILRRSSGVAVGEMPGVQIQCFTVAAKRWLEEQWSLPHVQWMIVTPLEKVLVKATGKLQLKRMEGSFQIGDDWYPYAWYEGETDRFEVVEAAPLEPPWGKVAWGA